LKCWVETRKKDVMIFFNVIVIIYSCFITRNDLLHFLEPSHSRRSNFHLTLLFFYHKVGITCICFSFYLLKMHNYLWAYSCGLWWYNKSRLSIPFRFARNDRNIPYQFKKQNKTEQISSHFKSRSVPDFSAKFRPERSGFIPHVPFRSWKTIKSNWTLFNLIN
jgi:hypothetical protein